ncbi:protein-disulfide reductase DsbD family protein [Kitasatospora aureofaciens]|uniref:protein-disulfide reductase DsbD family protein n=1 Tax=Kitasatospora aureofaciens TaxID=1894 RepID=UPI000524B5B0|nr:protein-disulfide reductase DsbD family protein [Kitasatospora aureofaciens]
MSPAGRSRAGSAVATLLLLGAAGCAADPAPAAGPAAGYSGGGVTVAVRLEAEEGGRQLLSATFTPEQAGFHLYSVDLPAGGVDGLGLPTRLTVRGGLAADGVARADRPLRTVSPLGLGVELPVYPDGAVTVTLPVRRSDGGPAEAVVSFGACSEQRCLIPVTDQVIPLGPIG